VAQKYGEKWNFHYTCGALDGKHVTIRCSHHSGILHHTNTRDSLLLSF